MTRTLVIVVLVGASLLMGCLAATPKSKLLEVADEDSIENMKGGTVRSDKAPSENGGDSSAPVQNQGATGTRNADNSRDVSETPMGNPANGNAPPAGNLSPEERQKDIGRDPLRYDGPLPEDVVWGTVPSEGGLRLQLGICQVIIGSSDKYTGKEFRLKQVPIPREIGRKHVAGEAFQVITDVPDAVMHVVVTEADLPGEDPNQWKLASWTLYIPPGADNAASRYGTNRLSKDERLGLLGGSFGQPTDNAEWTSALPPNLRCMFMPGKDVTYFIVNFDTCPKFKHP